MKPITLTLVPLDERPVNTRYPTAIAQIAGACLTLPPLEIRGHKRNPADRDAVIAWLKDSARYATAVIVSCDYLGYGNLINARTSSDTAAEVISRLYILTELKAPVHAFSLITRVSNADDNIEEPLYWKDWGTKFFAYSTLAHRDMAGDVISDDDRRRFQLLSRALPPADTTDWLVRRLRNHTVNLALLDLAAHGKIESLLLTSDDTSTWGLPSRERSWIRSWSELAPAIDQRLSMHPGADEVGSALVASLINKENNRVPGVWIDYAISEDSARVAPYEDRPVRETIHGQIEACGARIAGSEEDADLVLGVLTPSPAGKDYQPIFLENDRFTRTRPYQELFERLSKHQERGTKVMLADVAYPNGADPLAMEMLLRNDCSLNISQLASYGAWNTAGNTLGVVVAQGTCSLYIESIGCRRQAQESFLTHRFLEDWGYQTVVRREARKLAESLWGRREPDPESLSEQTLIGEFIETRLSELLANLQAKGIGQGLHIKAGSTRLPWYRTFEVDFELEQS